MCTFMNVVAIRGLPLRERYYILVLFNIYLLSFKRIHDYAVQVVSAFRENRSAPEMTNSP